jgi:hypothetical protein
MAERSITKLSKDENFVPKLVDILSLFVFQVAKKDGSLYPPTK